MFSVSSTLWPRDTGMLLNCCSIVTSDHIRHLRHREPIVRISSLGKLSRLKFRFLSIHFVQGRSLGPFRPLEGESSLAAYVRSFRQEWTPRKSINYPSRKARPHTPRNVTWETFSKSSGILDHQCILRFPWTKNISARQPWYKVGGGSHN